MGYHCRVGYHAAWDTEYGHARADRPVVRLREAIAVHTNDIRPPMRPRGADQRHRLQRTRRSHA